METPIIWQSTYNIGVQVIDEQHQHLIEIINLLAQELESTVGIVTLDDFFRELVSYGEYHFQTEETFFSNYEYPERSVHLATHVEYRKTMQDFLIKDGDSRSIANELISFLGHWWVNHITGIDQTLRGLTESKK